MNYFDIPRTYIASSEQVDYYIIDINVVFSSIPVVKNLSSMDLRLKQFHFLRAIGRLRFVLKMSCRLKRRSYDLM